MDYIEYHHPGWKWKMAKKYAKKAAEKAYEVYGAYSAHKGVSRRTHELNSFIPEMPVVGKRKRAASNKGLRGPYKIKKGKGAISFRNRTKISNRVSKRDRSLAKSKFVATHPTGYVGRFNKPKRKKRSFATKAFDKLGVVYQREGSFVSEGQECIYIGHGTAMNEIFKSVICAILRSLIHKAGQDIVSFEDQIGITGKVTIFYTVGDNTSLPAIQTAFNNTKTWYQVANDVVSQVYTDITDAMTLENVSFTTARLEFNRLTEPETFNTVAEINLQKYMLYFDTYSLIKVKNVTLADASFREGAASSSADDIESQPLVGKLYSTRGWANGFLVDRPVNVSAGLRQIYADVNSGIIAYNASDLGYADGALNPYRKPPPGYMFGTNRYTTVRLNPGELKTDSFKWKTKMLFNTYVKKCIWNLNTAGDFNYRMFGKAHMFAFEREVEIGLGALATRPKIRVASQVDFSIKVRGKSLAHMIPPIVNSVET